MTAPSTWFRATPVDEEPEGWDERVDETPVTEADVHPADRD